MSAPAATGRRKEATARVTLTAGTGEIVINRRPWQAYFNRELHQKLILQPFTVLDLLGRFNVTAKVTGGGISGQAGAVRMGLARALLQVDPQYRGPLRKAGLLTRDARMKERKKYGQKGARKRFQWTKR